MTERNGKEIVIEEVDPRELYGPQEAYLDLLRARFPALRLVARGASLKVLGAEAEVARFEKRFAGLVAYYRKYGHLSSEVIDQCFAEGYSAAAEEPLDRDVLVYGNNGARTRRTRIPTS